MSFFATKKSDPLESEDGEEEEKPKPEANKDLVSQLSKNGLVIGNKLNEISVNKPEERTIENEESFAKSKNTVDTNDDEYDKENTDVKTERIEHNKNNNHDIGVKSSSHNIIQNSNDNNDAIDKSNANNNEHAVSIEDNDNGVSIDKQESIENSDNPVDDNNSYVAIDNQQSVAMDNYSSNVIDDKHHQLIVEKPHHVAIDDNQSDEATDAEDEYGMTEDQHRAILELEMLKREINYVETEPPEYNVKDRLKQLNEDLENEPDIEKKNTRVMFKEDLVDLVVPADEETDDEGIKSDRKPDIKSDKVSHNQNNKGDVNNSRSADSSNKVLIECDGKFELVSPDDIRARDLAPEVDEELIDSTKTSTELYKSSSESDSKKESDSKESSMMLMEPKPPSEPRPQTATGVRSGSSAIKTRRVKSAPVERVVVNADYHSPYALTSEQKEILAKQKEDRLRKEADAKEAERQKKEEMRRENEEAFGAWLSRKQEEVNRKRKDDLAHKSSTEIPMHEDTSNIVKEWVHNKNKQRKHEKLLKSREDLENTKCCIRRSQDEVDQAYKGWLRQKAYEARKKRLIELMRNRARYLIMKRQRKAEAALRRRHKLQSHSAYRF